MEHRDDFCTFFFERFPRWKTLLSWEVVDISPCCEIHDDTCSFHAFIKCLWSKRVVGTSIIAIGGAIGCIVKFPSKMLKRIF